MASGNHTCRGTWADLPTAPQKSRRATAQANSGEIRPAATCPCLRMAKLKVPALLNRSRSPTYIPKSPILVVMKALRPAYAAAGRSNSKPIKR